MRGACNRKHETQISISPSYTVTADSDYPIEKPARDSSNHGRTSTCPARKCFTRAALEDAELDVVSVDDLRIACVRALCKPRVALDQRSFACDRRSFNVGNNLDGMGIPHGERA